MASITIESVKEAYARFKAFVYYDNFNLILRSQLAQFENEEDFSDRLSRLAESLNNYLSTGEINKHLKKLIKSSGFIVLPKSFKNGKESQRKNSILVSNKYREEYFVEKSTILFQGDIELHLIATLWIMLEGVKLAAKIGGDNYGYHLPMDEEGKKLGPDKLLFTKYFTKYQEWRDKGIRAAKVQIEEGNDVLLLSLDIKEFFHSTSIDFTELRKDLNSLSNSSLTDLIEKICIHHTRLLDKKNKNRLPFLPIGLVSSGVIANWHLSDFDKILKDITAPLYYGRYVDDIFIVISNLKPPLEENSSEESTEEDYKSKTLNWLSERFFPRQTPLKLSDDKNSLDFSEDKYKGLSIQADKLKLFYFAPDWPHAMLNKFQKALEENSSAFWFLPDEEDLKDSLDDEAYDMQYEDTINKFRSISDVKASKYGASVFLAKRIKLAVLNSGSPNDKITGEVFRFFKGVSILSLYNMWEKTFTYLVVTNDLKGIGKLVKSINVAINELRSVKHSAELKSSLREYLDVCLKLALSLNPGLCSLLANEDSNFNSKKDDLIKGIVTLRRSLLTRHHYLPLPSLIITEYYTSALESLLSHNLIQKLLSESKLFIIDDKVVTESWRIPRWLHLQELCILQFFLELRQWNGTDENVLLFDKTKSADDKSNYTDRYINIISKLFKKVNGRGISKFISESHFKTYREPHVVQPRIEARTIKINSKKKKLKLRLGLSNMKVNAAEIAEAIINKSKIDNERRRRHIRLLNQAEEEKVDLLILPEVSVPLEFVYAYADEARRKFRAFIFGVEHFTVGGYCFNFSMAILPFDTKYTTEVMIIPRLKNHYSPNEEKEVLKIGKLVPKQPTSFYHLFTWNGIQFTIYNCYELTDVVHRSVFRSKLDVLFAIEYNKDINYFSNIAESTCRDLHCFFVQANTSDYGDSRVIEPRQTEKMNPVRIKGGDSNVILRYSIDIEKLRAFQIMRLPFQMDDSSFKSTPPDFDHDGVRDRSK